ncbi:acyl-CoA thioesterase [Cryobacterium sp. PH29-G1]|uniref:acyl-CoA thioesterase n=1 Tax=Cryobacterium sp. PH29-G1 TaxID=3046211 RepID=UPI0024B9598D|nr:acyl-CoA thioesterase [Cryobacterium sp. PH29-G1]MDJ0350742.1 acyl-CoA thioesterase [Cryobacterium sp. PH29-G1]
MTSPAPQVDSPAPALNTAAPGFKCVIPIRWSDQDVNGHVNNARVVTLMEEARIQWLNQHAVAEGIDNFTAPKLIAALNVEYLKPIFHGLELTVEMAISRIGNRSFTISYTASQESNIVFRASTVVVPFDSNAGKARTLVETELNYLNKYLISPPRDGRS